MSQDGVNQSRRNFLTGATCVVGAVGVGGAAVPFVKSWVPSAKARAAGAPVRANISKIEPGQMITVEWRGKPVYVFHRDEEALNNLRSRTDHLADPESEEAGQQPEYCQNEYRSIRPEIMVMVGLCTHLGCAPLMAPQVEPQEYDPEWTGGFFCPCHGSKFDLAGRVYSGVPAPDNLSVPPHYYESDSVIVVGLDGENS